MTLALIWLPLLRRLPAAAVLVVAGASLAATRPALAYYDTVNRADAVTIMPNESAFWIPDSGANRDSQTNLDK